MVESASINKSLFVLAQCVEAISKKQARIPYRESKMTRILSLGQNNGLTVMFLNLASIRSYHLDTLSSLNFANRTKKIEVNEIENEPIFRGPPVRPTAALGGALNRQPLKPLNSAQNIRASDLDTEKRGGKPIVKMFSVFTDKTRQTPSVKMPTTATTVNRSMLAKRPLDTNYSTINRPLKVARPGPTVKAGMTKEEIEDLIERRLEQKLAEKTMTEKVAPAPALSSEVQRRLDALEERVSQKEDSEGLQYLLMAKQHQARREDVSALRMFQLAQPFYPTNEKLARKIQTLQEKIQRKKDADSQQSFTHEVIPDGEYMYEDNADESLQFTKLKAKKRKPKTQVFRDVNEPLSPRSQQLLDIINSRDLAQIKLLKGVGTKKAEAIVEGLMDQVGDDEGRLVTDLEQLGALRGVGWKSVENMRAGLSITSF
jgi:DNA uptake protein ComE-like DNA-binding protein